MTSCPLLALCLLGSLWSVRGCSPPMDWQPEPWPMHKVLFFAPYVVIATGVHADKENNMASLDVKCVLRPGGEIFPGRIYVRNLVYQHSCLNNPQFVLGANYILALRRVEAYYEHNYPKELQFDNYEPSFSVQNIFEATTPNLQSAYMTCGMRPAPTRGEMCPTGAAVAGAEECLGSEYQAKHKPSNTAPALLPGLVLGLGLAAVLAAWSGL